MKLVGGAAVGLACLLLVTGCSGPDPAEPDAGGPVPTETGSSRIGNSAGVGTLQCDSRIHRVSTLPTGLDRIAGAIALPTADSGASPLQAAPLVSGPGDGYFAKVGLYVRAGKPFTISVHKGQRADAWIGWGAPASAFNAVLRSDGCDGTGWLVFAGGVRVTTPMCVSIVAESDDRRERFRLAVGEDCPR